MSWKSMMMAVAVAYADPSLAADGSDEVEITGPDARAIANLVKRQIKAFRADDAATAFALTSPAIQTTFRTAERFLEMVKKGYPAVYRPQSWELGNFVVTPSGLGQVITIIGPDETEVTALYLLERQNDGTWRTNGCLVVETRELAV